MIRLISASTNYTMLDNKIYNQFVADNKTYFIEQLSKIYNNFNINNPQPELKDDLGHAYSCYTLDADNWKQYFEGYLQSKCDKVLHSTLPANCKKSYHTTIYGAVNNSENIEHQDRHRNIESDSKLDKYR